MRVGKDGDCAVPNLMMQGVGNVEIEVGIPSAPDDVNWNGDGLEARDASSIVRHCREEVARQRAKRPQGAGFGD